MKKMMTFFAAFICMMMMCACGSDTSTPEGTVKKAMECLKNKDFEGYAELIRFKSDDPEKVAKQKASIVSILQEKATKDIDAKGGIKSYDLQPAKIEEDKAKVETIITYGNGDTKKQVFDLVKTESGEWLLNSGK